MVRVWQRRHRMVCGHSLIVPALLVLAASGCKSSSWSSRPAWMGGSPSGSALTSAPAFEGGIAKPSETAKPYPSTNTPEGYVLTDSTRADTPKALATSPVTYGATPPPAAAAPTNPAAIATQVGPYAPLQPSPSARPAPPSDPADAVTAGLAAAPGFAGMATPPATPPSSERFADARGGGWGAPPPSQQPSAAETALPTDARYGSTTVSRFSGGGQSFQPAQPTHVPQPAPQSQPLPLPQWSPTPSSATPPSAAPSMPSAPADSSLPGTLPPPSRRPDPGYRPGGTSSYRPTRSLLAGEDEMSPVQPVSFDAPPQQQTP